MQSLNYGSHAIRRDGINVDLQTRECDDRTRISPHCYATSEDSISLKGFRNLARGSWPILFTGEWTDGHPVVAQVSGLQVSLEHESFEVLNLFVP